MRRVFDRIDPRSSPPEPGGAAAPDENASESASQKHGKQIAELFAAHNSALLRFLTCRLKSSHEAKEVAQEAYVRMLQLDASDGISYLQAFLFKTASNLAADRLKSSARRRRVDQILFFDDIAVSPSPESGVCAAQQIEKVLEAIDMLPAKCRYALIMHRFHGHEIADVAKLMHLSERMVRLYVERALAFCRKRLLATGGGE